jgi:hypothetical protein
VKVPLPAGTPGGVPKKLASGVLVCRVSGVVVAGGSRSLICQVPGRSTGPLACQLGGSVSWLVVGCRVSFVGVGLFVGRVLVWFGL